ncbi:MAG: hypothetical protein VYA98_03610, partial [Candidatus Thermoplasmatota archaeon]|nr:hypothetical protein [Candidatus Thermoplasmatota archaeon]
TVPANANTLDETMPKSSENHVAESSVRMKVSVVAIILHVRVLIKLRFFVELINTPPESNCL